MTSVSSGTNAFQWDLRYAPAYDVPGFRTVGTDDFPDTSDGPTILPGKYTVVLRDGTNTSRAPLNVQLDPRIRVGPGDLEARLSLELQILGTIDRLDRTLATAMAARGKLPADKKARLDSRIAGLVQLDIHSSEADTLHETKISEQLAFLMNSLEGAYARPTPAEYAAYQDLRALAVDGETKLQALIAP